MFIKNTRPKSTCADHSRKIRVETAPLNIYIEMDEHDSKHNKRHVDHLMGALSQTCIINENGYYS